MPDLKKFDQKAKSKKSSSKTVSNDLASTIKNTMWLWLNELVKTINWWADKQEVKKQDSIFVLKKWNQILPSEDKWENKLIKKRKHSDDI